MMQRLTLILLTSLATLGLGEAIAPAVTLAQTPAAEAAPETAPAQPDPFSVNPAAAVDTGTSVPNTRTPLDVGSRGDSVRAIQQRLQQQGYYSGPVDGLYGTGTQQAVEAFQQKAGLTETGRVDPPTQQRLGIPELPAQSVAQANEAAPSEAASEDAAPSTDSAAPPPTVPNTDSTPASSDEAAPEAAPETAAPSDSTGLLWPLLALVAAAGSFGIGFFLANRNRGEEILQPDETAWGTVAPAVSEARLPAGMPAAQTAQTPEQTPSEADGVPMSGAAAHGAVNGTANGAAVGTAAEQSQNGLSTGRRDDGSLSAVSETSRVVKLDVVDQLVDELRSTDPSGRRRAIWELGQRGNSNAIQPLVNAMVDADSKEKSLILAALSEIGIRSLKPMNRALAIALQDDSPDVRKNAIRDLTRIYDLVAQISQMLGHATEDSDPEVRRTADWALEQLGRIRQLPEVKSSLRTIESSRSGKHIELLPGDRAN